MTLPNKDHLPGIDWIRAFASLAVVAMHYEAFGGWIKGYVLCLSVPIFMLVSAFLFSRKTRTTGDWLKRCSVLLWMFALWSGLFYIANGGLPLLIQSGLAAGKAVVASPIQAVYYLVSGLETNYYFFFSLALVLTLAYWLQRMPSWGLWLILAGTMAVVAILPFVDQGRMAVFNNPLNFLPYAPLAQLLVRFESRLQGRKWLIGISLLALFVMTAWVEIGWQVFTPVTMTAGFTRVSLVILAASVLTFALTVRRTNRVVSFMAQHSLPLYLFHGCLFAVVWPLVGAGYSGMLHGPEAGLHVVAWMVAVALSYLVSVFIAPRILDPRLYRG